LTMKHTLTRAGFLFKLGINSRILPLAALALAVNTAAAGANAGVPQDHPAQRGRDDFAVQVGSYNEIALANDRAARLRSAGLDARVVRAEIRGRGVWYRVQAGRFASRDEASLYGAALLARGVTREFIVTKFSAVSPHAPPPMLHTAASGGRRASSGSVSQPAPPPAPPAVDVPLSEDDIVWVSTPGRKDAADYTPARILLRDGRTIGVDEVWEVSAGLWYRRGGVVAFLHRSTVKAVQTSR